MASRATAGHRHCFCSPHCFPRPARWAPDPGRLPGRAGVAASPPPVLPPATVECGLTIRSSRPRSAGRLNSSVRPQLYPPMDGEIRTMTAQVLRFVFELPRTNARLALQQQGIVSVSLTQLFPAACSLGARPWSAPGQGRRCGTVSSRLASRHGTVRPNNSFKPTPLRGSA